MASAADVECIETRYLASYYANPLVCVQDGM
jgi:hypothetical protein